MGNKRTYNLLNIVAILIATMFFSCQDNYKQVQKIGVSENEPIGEDYNVNVKYTDSGRVSANLISAKMLDYTNRDFPYNQFTDGVILHIYDKENKKSTITADNAFVYSNTNLIDMQDNVVITTADNQVLKTEQLFFNMQKNWLSTNKAVSFKTQQDVIYGNGFDSNLEFTNAEVLEVTGIIAIED